MPHFLQTVHARLTESLKSLKKHKAPPQTPQDDDDTRTPLLKLPVELILTICGDLSYHDTLSFCHTSHWLLSIYFHRPNALTAPNEHRESFCQIWGKSIFGRQAAAEMREYKHDLANASQLLCAFCLVRHPAAAFESTERGKVPYKRRCIGSTRNLCLCESHSITLEELRWQVSPERDLNLYDCSCSCAPTTWTLGDGQVASWKQIDGTHTFLPVSGYWARCVRYLDDLDEYVCPHMRTSDKELQDRLREGALEWRASTTPDENIKGTKVECVYAHCETNVRVWVNEKQVQVDITNEYGSLKVAGEERWCAQLEEDVANEVSPSSDHEHFWY
jgi:hypothetical protein